MIELSIKDMTCGGCVAGITKVVKALDASATVDANVGTKRVRIDSAAGKDAVIAAIADAGYHPEAVA